MAHVSDAKKEAVQKVKDLISEYPLVGVVNMANLPAPQLQRMREKLRDTVVMYMAKKRLIKLVLEDADKEGIQELEPYLKGIPALLFSSENPFKLYSIIQKNKSKAAAKAGQEAPNDITVSAGPTSFAPGPIISELGGLGLKTKVEDGKIHIIKDHVIVKEGEEITAQALDLIVEKTQGYPYFLQEWGYQSWNVAEQSPIVKEHVEQASQRALDRLDEGFFKVRFDRLTPKERDYVIAMAELGPGPYSSSDVAEQLGQPPRELGRRLAQIMNKGMI